MMTKTILIEGMSCGHCSARVQKALEGLDGVLSVIVDLDKKTAVLDSAKDLSNETLKNTIEEAGYDVKEIK